MTTHFSLLKAISNILSRNFGRIKAIWYIPDSVYDAFITLCVISKLELRAEKLSESRMLVAGVGDGVCR